MDHGLRPDSAGEAGGGGRALRRGRTSPTTLRWTGWDGRGNLQDRARQARRALIAGWARDRGIGAVALGHTLDDQAETFLLRLARGSGVDGLGAMRDRGAAEDVLWLRPMLTLRRAELRDWLVAEGVDWAEDPSNDDPAYDRVRARRALAPLATLGLGPERLAATAAAMDRARAALEAGTADLARRCLTQGAAGDCGSIPRGLGRAAGDCGCGCWRARSPGSRARSIARGSRRSRRRWRRSRRRNRDTG